jgi:hypothetical protein
MGHVQHTPTRQRAIRRSRDSASGPAGDYSSARFRYGGRRFAVASALPLDPGLSRPRRWLTLLAAAVRKPRRVVALIELVLSTRTEEVLLSQSAAGNGLSRYFNQRFLGVFPQNRLCRAVLLLPPGHADYVRGRHRQALRTNLRRAAAAGIGCEWIAEGSRAVDAGREIFRGRRHEPMTEADIDGIIRTWSTLFARPDITVGVAWDKHGTPLAIIAAAIDDRVCLIHAAIASDHQARWALHDYLVRFLIARGVKYLLCDGGGPLGALGSPPEIHHYQRLLGYELRHLVPLTGRPRRAAGRHGRFDVLVRYPVSSRAVILDRHRARRPGKA